MKEIHTQAPTTSYSPIRSLLFVTLFCLSFLLLVALQPSTRVSLGEQVHAKGKPSPSPTPTPLTQTTSTIYDRTADESAFVDIQSDDLNPDLSPTGGPFGIYGTSATNNVVDHLEGAPYSDWSLHLEDSATRWISLNLNRLSGSGPSGLYVLHARLITRCFDPTGNTTNTFGFPAITTSNPNCSMHLNFSIDGNGYGLIMSPYYADTGRATVTCNAVIGGVCADWSIDPNLTQDSVINPNPLVADLFLRGKGGKLILVGTYSLTYRIHLTGTN